MTGEAELIDRDGMGAAGACDRRSASPPPDAATPGWQPLAILTPDHHLPHVVPRQGAGTVQDSAVWSLRGVSGESMVDEREADLIRRVLLGDEALRLQQIVDGAHARCWSPDPTSDGPCQIR